MAQGIDFSKGGSRVVFVDGLGGKIAASGMNGIENEIVDVVKRQKEGGRKVLVILDGVDYLVAGPGAEVEEVMDMLQEIKDVCFWPIFLIYISPPPFLLSLQIVSNPQKKKKLFTLRRVWLQLRERSS